MEDARKNELSTLFLVDLLWRIGAKTREEILKQVTTCALDNQIGFYEVGDYVDRIAKMVEEREERALASTPASPPAPKPQSKPPADDDDGSIWRLRDC